MIKLFNAVKEKEIYVNPSTVMFVLPNEVFQAADGSQLGPYTAVFIQGNPGALAVKESAEEIVNLLQGEGK